MKSFVAGQLRMKACRQQAALLRGDDSPIGESCERCHRFPGRL